MAGIFISRGMTVTLPPGALRIRVRNSRPLENVTVHVRFDVYPTWIGLALRHLEDANARRAIREIAWGGTDQERKAASLEQEFEAHLCRLWCQQQSPLMPSTQ